MFCANCLLIFKQRVTAPLGFTFGNKEGDLVRTARYNYGIPYQDFLQAAAKCHCCHEVLRDSASRHHSAVSTERWLQFKMKWGFEEDDYDWGILNVDVNFLSGGHRFGTARFSTRRFEDYGHTWEQDDQPWLRNMPVTSNFPLNSTGSDYTAKFVKKCLQDCKSHHAECQIGGAPWYPTRLVEVLDDGGARIIETSEATPTGPYATLSHCWGASGVVFTTTTRNIDHLKRQIPLVNLPKTFSDAIQFIKNLGISLIWIDSLCIIQDSLKDWEFESRTMLQVYRHAECNLAGAASEDSNGGLFRQRDYNILPSGWFKDDNEVFHCALLTGYFPNAFDQQIGSSRLLSRGWVYQERAASNRIIAFGRDQVFWDCTQCLESDIVPGFRIRMYDYKDTERRFGPESMGKVVPKHSSLPVPLTLKSLDEGLVAWREIVKRYGSCAFTFFKDKPIAILGVAEMMSTALRTQLEAISTTYWAGLWVQAIYEQMAWKVAQTGLCKNNHAPSWSWLSIQGPADWKELGDKDGLMRSRVNSVSALATIAWPNTQGMESNSTFCELSADLRMWCSLYAVQVTEPRNSITSAAQEPCQSPDMALREQVGRELDSVSLDCGDVKTESLFFMPLIHTYSEGVIGILAQRAGDQPGIYGRCGFARLWAMPKSKSDQGVEIWDVPHHEKNAWIRRRYHLPRKPPSDVDFEYQTYDTELGYLIHLV